MTAQLIIPTLQHLPSYVAALESGWSPDNTRPEAAIEQLERIRSDGESFLRGLVDPDARGGPIRLPDGSLIPRLPGIHRWIWDREFCGVVGLRWQNGTSELPPHVLGHIGFAVVPWMRRQGYATRGLALMLPEARVRGLSCVELTTAPDNIASQSVIKANGGRLVRRFHKAAAYGGDEALLFRIDF
jgi:predicted acetyltransferase